MKKCRALLTMTWVVTVAHTNKHGVVNAEFWKYVMKD
jgi:hypothetical protein